jgi:nitrous oxidase accessory protein NosD
MSHLVPTLARRVALLGALSLGAAAHADTIHVFPDPGNEPIAAALAVLEDGDKLILNAGSYDERLTLVDLERIKVYAKGDVVFDSVGPSAVVSVTNCAKIQLRGLRLHDAETQGILVQNSEKVVVRDCQVIDQATSGITISASTAVKVLGCEVSGGTFGIYLSGATTARVQSNTVSDTSAQGIYVVVPTLPGIQIQRNEVSGSGNAAIELDGPGNRADRNTISDSLFGIVTPFVGGDMSGSRIAKNSVIDTTVALRTYASGGLAITANVAEQTIASGLQIATGAEGVVVSRNRFDGGTGGVDDEGTGSIVSRNTISGTSNHGIRARGNGGSFERNSVHDTDGAGFLAWTGGNTFTRNKASGNAGNDFSSTVAEVENTFVKNQFGTQAFP